jgi:hypothetical protein
MESWGNGATEEGAGRIDKDSLLFSIALLCVHLEIPKTR